MTRKVRTFKGRLNHRDIIRLLREKKYRVKNGKVQSKKGNRWCDLHEQNMNGYRFVWLYGNGKRRKIGVHSMVWMSVTHFPIPHRFEVHHRDLDKSHNLFDNLMCIHKLDHDKFHQEHHNNTPF